MSEGKGCIESKIVDALSAKQFANKCRLLSKSIVFTNGCFDILHYGHFKLIEQAASLGDVLIVGVNSDESVKKLKGTNRPLIPETERAYALASLHFVSQVVIFKEETPQMLIEEIIPNVLVKGGDYTIEQVVGADFVAIHGGRVEIIPYVEGFSTSSIIEKIQTL